MSTTGESQLRREIKRLRTALEPFAQPQHYSGHIITIRARSFDLRRARMTYEDTAHHELVHPCQSQPD